MRRLERRPLSSFRDRRTRRSRPWSRRPDLLLALRRRPRLRWAAAVGLAVIAAVGVYGVAAAADAERHRWGATRTVVVAARDLTAGDTVEPGDVELRPLPRALVPATALRELPAGRVLTATTYAGEVLDDRRLAPTGLSGVAALVPSGSRAVAVPADPSAVPLLTVGDRVDVVVATDTTGGPFRPSVATEGAVVVHLGEQSVTVAVPEHEAPAVAVAATGGLVALTLAGASP